MRLIRRKKERLFTFHDKSFVACTFQAQKYRNDGTITYQGPVFHNTILDVGMDLLSTHEFSLHALGDVVGDWINVGDDNADPSTSQSGLLSRIGSTQNAKEIDRGYSTDPYYKWLESEYEFDIGECTGNLTEVGLSAKEDEDYFNRQLFKDDNGDSTTITVKDDEGLRIRARLYFYPDIEPGETVGSSFTLTTDDGDETIDVTREIQDGGDWLKDFERYDRHIAGFQIDHTGYCRLTDSETDFEGGTTASSKSSKSYSSGDHYNECSYTWDAGKFVGDIASVLFYLRCGDDKDEANPFTAFRLDPKITLEDTQQFTITLRRAWARYAS